MRSPVYPRSSSLYSIEYGAIFERANWWLRDVANSTNFANVNNNGGANNNNASNSNGVRPDFDCIECKTL